MGQGSYSSFFPRKRKKSFSWSLPGKEASAKVVYCSSCSHNNNRSTPLCCMPLRDASLSMYLALRSREKLLGSLRQIKSVLYPRNYASSLTLRWAVETAAARAVLWPRLIQLSLLLLYLILSSFLSGLPDRPFHNFGALKSVARRSWSTQNLTIS